MSDEDVAFAGIAAQAVLLRSRQISAVELTELCLRRIEQLNPLLNAFRVVFAGEALAAAREADGRLRAGAAGTLLGVPVAIKDGWDVRGGVTTHGTGAVDLPAAADSEFVLRLRHAGAVVIGKTNQPELAMWMHTESDTWGATRNPWDAEVIPGGSSGGSGAAVAAGLVGAASASDGAGSIRLPASACGLVGLKPQRGRVPLTPYIDHWHGLTVAGCVTRRVVDTALWLDVVSGPSPHDPYAIDRPACGFVDALDQPIASLRVAVCLGSATGEAPTAEISLAVKATAEALTALGHVIENIDVSYSVSGASVAENHQARYLRGVADDFARLDEPNRAMSLTRTVAQFGTTIDAETIARHRGDEARLRRSILATLAENDVLLTPTVAAQPFRVGDRANRDVTYWAVEGYKGFTGTPFLIPANVTGLPAIAIPAGFDRDGLPLSVQFIGREGDEATLLAVAAQLEAAWGWPDRRPPIAVTPPEDAASRSSQTPNGAS